jgi:RNA polymerase sigma-70 factor (ECF subfamily)
MGHDLMSMGEIGEAAGLRLLLEAAREGDDVAVRELVRRTQPIIWRVCSALGSADEADDLVQDTYLRALRGLSTYRGDGPVIAWLSVIARRVCADHVRSKVRHRRMIGALRQSLDDRWDSPPGNPTHELLEAIDSDRRDAFMLTQVAGLSYDEAAALLDCPVGTIRSRVARARADLLAEVRAAEAS